MSTIKNICDGLKRYYESLDEDYDKLFTNYCDDNGFDTDQVIEEIGNDPMENMLIDFDDEFPFASPPESTVAKTQQILLIIQKIYHNPSISFEVQMPQFNRALFDITEKDIKEIRKIYKKQCPVIYSSIELDVAILCILAIGRKSKIDYLQHLVDDYSFARIKAAGACISEEKWASNHNHFRLLKNIKGALKLKGLMQCPIYRIPFGAVKAYGNLSYGAKISPKLTFTHSIEINDSLETVIKYIHAVVHFIGNLISTNYCCPFQVDLWIAGGESIETDRNKIDNIKGECIDYIGNIKQKLEENKLNYILQNDIDTIDI
eukprot:138117_1